MSNRTRSLIKGVAMLIVLLAVMMNLRFVIIPALEPYNFWLVVIAFGLIVISTR